MPVRPARLAVAAAAVFAVVAAGARPASALTMNLDPVHSMSVFRIGHANASEPFGIFHGVEGTVEADKADSAPTAVTVTAHLAKLDMGNDAWEKHIRSADFFNAAQFPDITFKSTSVKATNADTFEVTGQLSLHGVTKTKTITLHRIGVGKGMQGETRVGFGTEFTVSRKEFGITKYAGAVGDEVTLLINLEGVIK